MPSMKHCDHATHESIVKRLHTHALLDMILCMTGKGHSHPQETAGNAHLRAQGGGAPLSPRLAAGARMAPRASSVAGHPGKCVSMHAAVCMQGPSIAAGLLKQP